MRLKTELWTYGHMDMGIKVMSKQLDGQQIRQKKISFKTDGNSCLQKVKVSTSKPFRDRQTYKGNV